MLNLIWVVVLIALLAMALLGEVRSRLRPDSHVDPDLIASAGSDQVLYVWIHGYRPKDAHVQEVARTLRQLGDVLMLDFPSTLYSDADPEEICKQISSAIAAQTKAKPYARVVLVAHSVGALLARRSLLVGLDSGEPWATAVQRVVLLAGANRGWSVGGEKPMDMPSLRRTLWRFGAWGAQLTGWGTFILKFQAGTPFVANLRLDWMQRLRDPAYANRIEVVQLLGDIDDVVNREDSADLRVMASKNYAFLRVRGTGHGDIIDFADAKMGAYRKEKLLSAVTEPFATVVQQSEEQPYTTEEDVRTIVFVLHGIRDLGEWSSEFETELRAHNVADLRIVSPRYGYLGMGPFLLPAVRAKYVRWFMDEYTQTLARYPNVKRAGIKFFGHSNGTYLLADALANYRSMRIDRIVFAGSVVPRAYDWNGVLSSGQVAKVRNYVGTTDWVVALFPRLFEWWPTRWLGNRLGSAGFAGFDAGGACDSRAGARIGIGAVENVCYVQGEHGAFESRVQEIVSFLVDPQPAAALEESRSATAAALLSPPVMYGVWLALIGVVLYLGVRVVSAAPSPAWVVLVLYVLLVIRTLQVV